MLLLLLLLPLLLSLSLLSSSLLLSLPRLSVLLLCDDVDGGQITIDEPESTNSCGASFALAAAVVVVVGVDDDARGESNKLDRQVNELCSTTIVRAESTPMT